MKVKIIQGENHLSQSQIREGALFLEDKINAWLRKNDSVEIKHIFHTGNTISIWYEEPISDRELK